MVSDDESDTISVFTDIPEEISPDSDYAKKLLEDEIIRGSGFSNGKFRISEYVSENSPSKDELAKFLKNEYGIGGSSRNDDPVSFSNHDGKGIELVLSNKQVIRFNWKKVAEAVRSAVNSGKYITESDIETRRRMTLFDAQRFAIHYEYPHCLYNDRLDYIRKEIAACGLDYPIRLNADMFAVYAAECVRTKPHVKESYQKIDRSSIDIPWKFNDWSEAAEAGKNLPVDSGYGQFRAMCRDSVSELMNEISAHTGHNPALGFPEEEITEFFASGEPLTSDSVDKITSEVFGYLYNQEQHSRLSYNNPTEIIALDQPAEQFTLFGDNKFTMEEPPVDELPDESLNRAAAYIKDYFEQEFGSAAEIEDPSHVDLAYTTDEENDAVISVYADLVQYRITTEYGGNIAREEQYNSLDEMNELALKFLSFDDLICLSDGVHSAGKLPYIVFHQCRLVQRTFRYNIRAGRELHCGGGRYRDGDSGVPFFFFLPIIGLLVIVLAVLMYFQEKQKVDSCIKEKRKQIEFDLPRFVYAISQEIQMSHDVISILERHKDNFSPYLNEEIEITIADMRTGNYEAAITRFEWRIGSTNLSEVCRGFIQMIRGDDTSVYWETLAIRFSELQKQYLRNIALKIPPKVHRLSFFLMMSMMLLYVVVLGWELLSNMGVLFG